MNSHPPCPKKAYRFNTIPKSVSVGKTKVRLASGKTYQIKAKVIVLKKGKKLIHSSISPDLRYYSSNKYVATVSKSGKIKAVAQEGICEIYVLAANGVRKTIEVTVKQK